MNFKSSSSPASLAVARVDVCRWRSGARAGRLPARSAAAGSAAAPGRWRRRGCRQASASDRPAAQNWLKICRSRRPKAGASRPASCARWSYPNNQFLGSFLLRDDPGQESRLLAVAAVPLGVLLPFGVTWQIDGDKPIRVPYMLCDPQSCASQLVINEAYVDA